MKSKINRREFLTKCSMVGFTGCGLMVCSGISALEPFAEFAYGEEIDPKKLNYCGYKCPEECQFLKGSLEDNIELKKEAYELWKIKERFDIEFDPDKIFCFGCKTTDKPEGVVLVNCTVRSCAISKEYDCCIECLELVDCDKDLWSRFPEFKKQVIELQKKYLEEKQ
ncbi:MAG: DUF3795 domain-containing protein [Bacteroidales bacterium]|nr:MAG: DUF3795 domain-containing protein [Bacteroidales bacterium]